MAKIISGMRRAQLRELTKQFTKDETPNRMEILFPDVECYSSHREVKITKKLTEGSTKEITSCPYMIESCTTDFELTVSELFIILNYLNISCTDEQIDKIINREKYKISTVNRMISAMCIN